MAALAGIDNDVYKLEKHLATDTAHGILALKNDELVAWAIARHIEPKVLDDDHAPPGWYLMGVEVSAGHRRRGLGAQLTRMRLEWLAERTHVVRYFALPDNLASISLHKTLGFVHVRDGLTIRPLCFDGGPYALFELNLSEHTTG